MAAKIRIHPLDLESSKRIVSKWKVPETVKKEVLRFIHELELGKANKGVKASEAGQIKYLQMLRIPLEFWSKKTDVLNERDIEMFEKALSIDEIRSRAKRKPYSQTTKVDIRKSLKFYLRWRLGDAKAVQLVGWLDTRNKERTPDFLKEHEVEKLYRKCRAPMQRYIVAVLFDTGARAEEFINIRYEDIHLPEGKDNFVRITLKEEYSKTKGRTISLYWRHSLEAVREFLTERIAQGLKSTDPVFTGTYNGMRMFLRRLGISTLRKTVHPHLFRHSSATYYATKLNRQELCYRYGWKFSSNMPDVYISRSGMENKDLDVKFAGTELSTVKDELAKVQVESTIKDDRIAKLEEDLRTMKDNLQSISEVLKQNPSAPRIEALIRKKRSTIATRPES